MINNEFDKDLIRRMRKNISLINEETEERMRGSITRYSEEKKKKLIDNDMIKVAKKYTESNPICSDKANCYEFPEGYFSDKVMALYGKVTTAKMFMDKYLVDNENINWEEAYKIFKDRVNF